MTTSPPEKLDSESVNSPELSKSGKVTRRSITSPEQAFSMCSHMERNNEERNKIDSACLRKYNGAQPYEPAELRANLEDWRSNAPTGFMSGIIDRITPVPIQAIESARYLTSASLDSGTPEDETKSKYFQLKVTKAIRSWDGWKDFLASLCQEDVLMGRAAPLSLNPFSPWPKMFHGDEVFFDDGVGQHARVIPALAAKEDLLIHEFVDFIDEGREISETAGWDFDACIAVVNDALPKVIGANSSDQQNARAWEDAVREGNYAASHQGAKVVQLYHALAVEADSKTVTHYIVNRTGKHELLFRKEERFDKMEDVVTLFSLQPGNGKYYSSRGIGRLLINTHITIERSRNGMLDNLMMGGMKILQVPANTTPSLQFKAAHPFMIVSGDGTFEEHGITSNVKDYVEADNQVSRWVEQQMGSYITGVRTDSDTAVRTATESEIDATRDAQARSAFLARFWGQFADLVSQITRRLCDPETTDKIAKELQEDLKDPQRGNMTNEEIKKLSNAPAAEVVQDLTSQQNIAVIKAYEVFRGDSSFDQHKLKERVASAMVNPAFTADVLLDEQGASALDIEQARLQILETEAILAGSAGMPVSPRDIDPIHLKIIFSDLKGALPGIAQSPTPQALDHLNTQLVHSSTHIKSWQDKGAPPEEIKPFIEMQRAMEQALQSIAENMQGQMEQTQSQGGSPDTPEAPPASPGAESVSEPPGADKEPTAPSGGMSEKVLTSWISQYPNLPDPEREKLEQISGLNVAPLPIPGAGIQGEGIQPISSRMAPRMMGAQRRAMAPMRPSPPVAQGQPPTEEAAPAETPI